MLEAYLLGPSTLKNVTPSLGFDNVSRWEILVKEQVVEILRNTLEKNSNNYNNRKTTKIQVREFSKHSEIIPKFIHHYS